MDYVLLCIIIKKEYWKGFERLDLKKYNNFTDLSHS